MSDVRTVRREPPSFRAIEVRAVHSSSPWMRRVTVGGPGLTGFRVDEPAASVRLLLPSTPGGDLVQPAWNGNEFLLPDGRRPVIRTLTPLPVADPDALDVAIVVHGDGRASQWAATAEPGAIAAISGPGRGYTVDVTAGAFLVAGDETALPALSQLLPRLPASATVDVHIEIAHADASLPLAESPRTTVAWHLRPAGAAPGDALVDAVVAAPVDAETRVWIAGEAASMQRIRRHLFGERGLPRTNTTIRGYWKHGRAGGDDA